jgi:hypothetical protein
MGDTHFCRVLDLRVATYPRLMTTVHIEHPISDFATWKAAFDRAAPLRADSRVRAYEIHQPVDDPAYVTIRLDFDDSADAHAFVERLRRLWTSRDVTPALRGAPQVRFLERKERMPAT